MDDRTIPIPEEVIMSADVLAALESELRAIPAADVRRPDMPVAVYHQEAHDLFQWIAAGDAGARLTAIGCCLAVRPDP